MAKKPNMNTMASELASHYGLETAGRTLSQIVSDVKAAAGRRLDSIEVIYEDWKRKAGEVRQVAPVIQQAQSPAPVGTPDSEPRPVDRTDESTRVQRIEVAAPQIAIATPPITIYQPATEAYTAQQLLFAALAWFQPFVIGLMAGVAFANGLKKLVGG